MPAMRRIGSGASASLRSFEELRKVDVGYDIPPALMFFPTPPRPAAAIQRNRATPIEGRTPQRPGSEEEHIAMQVQLFEWQLLFDYCARPAVG